MPFISELKSIGNELIECDVSRETVNELIRGVAARISTDWNSTMSDLPGHLYEITKLRKLYRTGRVVLENDSYGDQFYESKERTTVTQQKWSTATSQRGALRNVSLALTQLTGEKGENPPAASNRLIADVVIAGISEEGFRGKLDSYLDTGVKSFAKNDMPEVYKSKEWGVRVTHRDNDQPNLSKKKFYSFGEDGSVTLTKSSEKERKEINDVISMMILATDDYKVKGKDKLKREIQELAQSFLAAQS
ncbi:hypothetical protein [Microbulbifer sp. GL-2]|uniref:hypothetical protein n=1 Tax=Microbulbifer sp. GL-2 TaxID=2591606 RepID=UPI001164F4F5|nr:hypothetical protein [Microbulbifer sp. GL-2]BBM04185.1 hypothetical protein GL2_42590 [Microbulbifer sp. GL-2]